MVYSLLGSELGIGDYYHHVARLDLAGRSAIEAYHPAALFTSYCIGVKPLAIIVVYNPDAFSLKNVCCPEERPVDCDTADIVKIRLCHCHSVNLRFHHFYKHLFILLEHDRLCCRLALLSRNTQ